MAKENVVRGAYLSMVGSGNSVKAKVGGWSQADQGYMDSLEGRGDIRNFTKKSRKRLMNLMGTIDVPENGAVFLTLTYPAEFPSAREAKKHLNVFQQVIRRNFPQASGIWRLEFQKRGAPHFHMIMFNLPFWHKEAVAATWERIIGSAAFTRIEHVRSKRGCFTYLSKYVAKVDDTVDLTTLHNSTHESVGRFWGVHNRDELPLHDVETMMLFDDDWERLMFFWKGTVENCAHHAEYLADWPFDLGFECFVTNANDLVLHIVSVADQLGAKVTCTTTLEGKRNIRHWSVKFAPCAALR